MKMCVVLIRSASCFHGTIRKILCGYSLLSGAMIHINIFLISLLNENEYPQYMLLSRNKKKKSVLFVKKKNEVFIVKHILISNT